MTPHQRARLVPIALLAGAAFLAAGASAIGETKSAKRPQAPKAAPDKARPAAKPISTTRPGTEKKSSGKKTPAPKATARRAAAAQINRRPAAGKHVPMPRARPRSQAIAAIPALPAAVAPSTPASAAGRILASAVPMLVAPVVGSASGFAPAQPVPPRNSPLTYAPGAPPSEADVDAVREGLELARRGKTDAATERRDSIRDTAGQKLVEWMILRTDNNGASFARYSAFARANPAWPSAGMIRRRAEGQLWNERRDPGTVFAFFSAQEPLSTRGKLAMARAALAQGDRAGAQRYARDAWRGDDFSAELEAQVLESFGELLTPTDHKARLHTRLYSDDLVTAMRAAKRLGAAEAAIVQARIAVNRKAGNAGALLDAVPAAARQDAAYILTRAQWLRRNDRVSEAAQLMFSAPRDANAIHDPDEWWIERRLIARKLLDEGHPQAAYRVARDAVRPTKENPAVEQQFTAGWIALRFLNDAGSAARHFAAIEQVADHPTSLARAGYWLGRAAEASGRTGEARRHYESAARYSAAYYGQLARARLGHREIAVRQPPALSSSQRAALRNVDLVRALELLYATGNRDLVITFVADLDRVTDVGALTLLAETAGKNNDARAMLMIGKSAIARGYAFDQFAFPGIGIPKFASIGPDTDRSLVYSIARQESAFNPRAVSTARAMGLMQVTPGTGRVIARKFGVTFNAQKLLSDPTYNAQMGAAEIGDLVRDYDGNHVLAFVGYNAGRGRVKEWVARYGDPRNPNVDVIDWVERIPFTETRNYVQRVMENMQVYRARFGDANRLTIEADMRGARQ